MTYVPARQDTVDDQINPFVYQPKQIIKDDWALDMDPTKATDRELRAGAFAIMSEKFGILDHDGRTFSGKEHQALTGADYYAKARKAFESGKLPYTDDWIAFRQAEEAGDRAAMRNIAKENYRGESAGDDLGAFVDKVGSGFTDPTDLNGLFAGLDSIRDALSPEDAASLDAAKKESEDRWSEKEPLIKWEEMEDDEAPHVRSSSAFGGGRDWRSEERKAKDKALRDRVAGVYQKYHDTLRDEQRIAKYEKQLLDDNLFAQIARIKNVVSDDARKVLEMAQDAMDNPTSKPVLDAFQKLSTVDQRAIAGALQSLHYGRDTTLLGDCFRSFWDTTRQTVGGAIRSAADSVRQSFMDEKDYRDYVERRSLLESVNRERMKEWGYLGQSVIGAFSTIPYMAAASVPYAGTAIVMASAADQFQTEAALNGVDVGSREFAIDKWLFAGAYAAVEKAQLLPFKPIGAFSRRQAYADMFGSLRNVLMVSGSIVGNTLGETVEEGVQGGIERVVESWGIPRDIARDFAAGFAQDFVESFGTMALVGTAAAGRQAYRYRNGAVGLDKTEQLGAMAQARDTANAMEGHPDTTPQPLARFGKVWGRLSGQWLQGGNDKNARIAIIEKWGFTHEQASEMDGFLQTMWKGASGSEELKKAFVGGNKILSAAELAAKTLKTDVRREDDGSLSVLHRVGKRALKLRFRPEDAISSAVDPETNDEGMIMSIVERLNREDRAAGKTGDLTLEGWKALTPEQRAARVKGLRVNGNIVFESEDGAAVGADALSVLSGRVILTDDAMPQTVFHEAMHGVLRILRDQAETDPEAKALQDALAKIAPAQNEKEAVNEEEFGDLFQQFLTGRVSVVEGTDWLSVFQRWVARLLGDGEAAVSDLLNKQNDVGRLFNLALTGDISPALKAEEGAKPEPEGAKSAEDSAARASISGLYTGSAADYAQRDERGNIVNGPSLLKIGTGEGSQVYGWGLYGSNVRGVAERYASLDKSKKEREAPAAVVSIDGKETAHTYNPRTAREIAASAYLSYKGNRENAIADVKQRLENWKTNYEDFAHEYGKESGEAERAAAWVRKFKEASKLLRTAEKIEIAKAAPEQNANLYEQTFFTNRDTPEETERHLLKWYEPVSEEQLGWIDEQIDKEDYRSNVKYLLKQAVADARKAKRTDGKDLYSHIAGDLNMEPSVSGSKERATSEFLARAGIDGVKYPVDSFGGKGVKDGDKAGWNYVSFRDDNIRVDHKWVDGEQRYSISGVIGAEELGLRGVADAEKLERDGADRETIWRQTGWWRARDGEWRVEIPDFELSANLNGSKEDLAEERKLSDREFNLMLAIRDANKDFDNFHFRRVAERMNVPEADRASFDSETEKKEKAKHRGIDRLIAEREKASRDLEALRSKKIVRALAEGRTVRLSDVIKPDSALANAYPSIGEIRVYANAGLPYGVAGQWNGNSIDLSPELLRGDPEKFRSVLAHEVQHVVQTIEGFARGGDETTFRENVLDEERIKAKMFSPELSESEYADLQRQLAAIREGRGGQVFADGKFFNTPFDAYRHLAGEAEARLVQKRLNMTPEERAARPPWEDYDVEEERMLVRYQIQPKTAPHGMQKQSSVEYPDAGAEIARFSIGVRRREEYRDLLARKRPDLDAESVLAELDKLGDPKKEKVALHWVVRGSLLLPQDAYKIDEALDVAAKAKVDPFAYKSPDELLLANKQFKPSARPIDPATVPELSDARDEGDGIVSYLVQDDRQGQAAMRRIIDTHWGEDANPWCLLARTVSSGVTDEAERYNRWLAVNRQRLEGLNIPVNEFGIPRYEDVYERETGRSPFRVRPKDLDRAWDYWNYYNALPKRVAFKDGRLLAFMATDVYDSSRDMFGDEILNRLSPEEADRLRREYEEWDASDEGQEEGADFYEWLDHEHPDVIDQANEAEQWWDRQDESHPDLDWARGDMRWSIGSTADIENETTKLLQQGTPVQQNLRPGKPESARRNFVVTEETLAQFKERVKRGIHATGKLIEKLDNGAPLNANTIIGRLAKALHLPEGQTASRYGTYAREDGAVYGLRLSDHSATPEEFNTHGSAGDFNLSLVVQEPGNDVDLRGSTPNVVIRQFTWDKSDFTKEDARKFLESVKALFETGDFRDLTKKAVMREQNAGKSPFLRQADVSEKAAQGRASITSAADAAYMDAVSRGDMEAAQRMVREAAAMAMPHTKVVDDNGEPLVVFHGTTNEETSETWNPLTRTFDIEHSPFTVFRRRVDGVRNSGAFFNSSEDNAGGYGSRVYKVFLNLRNPLVIDANNSDYSHITHNGATRDTYEWAEWAERNGYDGLIIKNVRDGVDYGAMSSATTDYVAFRPNQIKSADPVTYDDAGNVIPLSQRFDETKRDIRFSLSSAVERTPDLVAFHNVSEAGLRGMDELGGLAVPSFAVTKDSIGGDEFGEVSLLVRPEVIDPRRPTNKAFSGDAWTPAFPSTKLRADEKKSREIGKRFKDIFLDRRGDAWDQFSEGWSSVYGDGYYFQDLVNRTSDLEATLRDRDVFKAAFLLETGREFPLPTKEEDVFKSGFGGGFLAFIDNRTLAAIADSPLADRLLPQGESVSLDEAEALVADKGFMEQLRRIVAENTTAFDGLPEQDRKDAVASWGKDEIRSYKLRDLADSIDGWRSRGGARQVLDRGAAAQAVNAAIEANRDEFAAWIKDLVAGITDGKRYIRNERDPYTPSGRPRSFEQLHDPLTLDAVVRAMLKQQKAQGNGVFGSNPFGVAAKEFKSLGEIVKDEGRLQKLSREEVGKLKDALLERFTELATEYAATQKSPDDNPFIAFDRAADMMMDAYANAKGNKARLAKELNGWGYRASDDFVARFSQVMQDMASMPEDYFEAKAYRAVHFDEIAEALVPDNADPATLDILRSRGVPFRTYKAGDTADRLRALNEAATAQKARFSISSSDVTTFRSMDEAVADAGNVARASISWNGPAYSHRSFATAYAARDRLLGIQRPDEDYQKLLDALGVEGLPVEELLAEADKVGREGAREDAREIAQLAGVAERRSFQKTVERMLRGSLHLGADVGAGARRAYEVYLAHVRRTAKGRDYDDFCMDLGMDPAALALSIEEAVFDPDNPAATNPATEPGAEPPTASQPGMDDDLAALLDGKAEDFGLTEDQLRERVNKRFEERTREIKERLERLRGRLDEWRRKEAERQERLAKRQQEQGKTDLDDDQMFDENEEETEVGAKALEDYESECVEEMPDFKAFIEECRREGLDLSNAAEFVAAVRLWVEDFIARETGSDDPADALRDPVALARYRATMMRFLRGLADSMLDPEDGAAAKMAERMMQEIPSDATVAEIDSRARVLVAFIQRNGIRQTRKQLIRELRKQIKLLAIKGKKFDETERDLGRKITGEREAAARYLYRILTWSDGMIAKESRRLHDIVSGREAAYRENGASDAELNDLARTDREVHRAQERLQMLETYGGLRKKAPADIKLAARAIVEWLEEGREAHEKRWNDWRASIDSLAERIVAAASARKADFTPDDPGFVGKLADELTATVRQRLEHLFAGSGAEGQRVIDELMSLVYSGSERMRVESVRARRNADALLSRCVEGTGRSANDFLKSLDELIPEDLNRAIKTAEQPVRMTNGQALQLLASLEQTASYAANIDANGRGRFDRDGNEQTPHAVLLRRYFEDKPEMVRLLEGVREQYEERRGELSDAFLAVTGNPILSPGPLYSPVKMFMGAGEGFETSVHAWDPFGPSFAPRVKNTKDFDLRADIWDIYQSRTRETSRALAWGVVGMELRSALLRKEVQDAIARNHGKFALRQLVKQLTDVVSDGWTDEPSGFKALAQKLGNVTTYSALSWNAVTMLKQMTSIPTWTALMDGGYAEVFRNIASFDRDACKELMDAPGFVARYGSDSFAKMFKEALHDPQGGNLLKRFFSAGMTAVQFGDFVPGIVVGTGVYKARKLALMRGGMEERQARDEAARIAWGLIEECQQSSRLENTPAFLRRGGFMARQAAKFASSPLLQVSHEWHTLRMWAAEARIEAERAGRGGNLASQMWAAEGDDAKRWRRRFVNQVICNHVLMPAAMYSIATLFNMALGSEPPDEDEVLGDLVMQMLSGPFSRIFLIGMVFDKGGEAVARMMGGKPNVYDSTGLASQQYLQKVFGQIGRIGGDVADADWESVRDDFIKMLGQVSAPARYAIKAGQNIADYDPAEARRERKAELRKSE